MGHASSPSGAASATPPRGIALAIDAPPSLRYDVLFITSDNHRGYRDLTRSREILGYVPQDHAEDYR